MRSIRSACWWTVMAAAVFVGTAGSAGAVTHTVTIASTTNFGTLNIAFGDTVVWKSTALVSHNAVACADVGANFGTEITNCSTSGGRFTSTLTSGGNPAVTILTVTFNQPADSGASYPYKCIAHPSFMQGKIVVGLQPMPEIRATPSEISQTISQGANASSQSIFIGNDGVGTLSYSVSDDVSWLSLSPCTSPAVCSATSETDTITVNYSTASLAAGAYAASIQIASSNATNSPQFITVSLTVNDFSLVQTTLTADDGQADDQFGFSVSISGDTLAIGARFDDTLTSADGSVYVYRRSGVSFAVEQKLTANTGILGLLGRSVSLDGDLLLVGAPNIGTGASRAYIFERVGANWTQQNEFVTNLTFTGYGWSVSVEGDLAAIGAPFEDSFGTDAGAVYIYKRSGSGWTLEQKLPPLSPAADAEFGTSLALSNGKIAIGSPGKSAVSVYRRVLAGRGNFIWLLEDEIPFLFVNAGHAVDLDGDRMIVGTAPFKFASVLIFDGLQWVLEDSVEPLAPGAASEDFGNSVSIDGSRVVVGDPSADFTEPGSGAGFLYERNGSDWAQLLKFGDSGGQTSSLFGDAVAVQGDTLVVGASRDNDMGSVFVYEPPVIFEITSGPSGTPNPVASEGVVEMTLSGVDNLGNPAAVFVWDSLCFGPSGPTDCSHDLCDSGVALVSGCDMCVSTVCEADGFCCEVQWDGLCVGSVETLCGNPQCAGTFSDATVQSPNWTAPSNPGVEARICEINVRAGNGFGDFDVEGFTQLIPEPNAVAASVTALLSIATLRYRRRRVLR